MDVLIDGIFELDATISIAGDTMDIYIAGQYSGTATNMTGGIDALFDAVNPDVNTVV